MAKVIESDWANERGYKHADAVTVTTARQGRRATGGPWTRPDIVSVVVRSFLRLPGKYLDVITFEVKTADCVSVQAVYEALAHRRAATQSYVLFHVPDTYELDLEPVVSVASQHGIGVIVAGDPRNHDTWDTRVVAQRVEPDPEHLDDFIAKQLPDVAERIAGFVR